MGTTYQLAKIDKGEYFDLNKAMCGLAVYFDQPTILPNKFTYQSELIKVVETCANSGWKFKDNKHRVLYIHKLTGVVWDWCGWDRIMYVMDCEFDDRLEHMAEKYDMQFREFDRYRETGSRFFGDTNV